MVVHVRDGLLAVVAADGKASGLDAVGVERGLRGGAVGGALDGDDGVGGRAGNDLLARDAELELRLGLGRTVELLVGGDVAGLESNVVAGRVGEALDGDLPIDGDVKERPELQGEEEGKMSAQLIRRR